LEEDYSSIAHMMKASVNNDGISFFDSERLLYLLGDRNEESFDSRLYKVLKTLPPEIRILLLKPYLLRASLPINRTNLLITCR